jgi:hypothetical protein
MCFYEASRSETTECDIDTLTMCYIHAIWCLQVVYMVDQRSLYFILNAYYFCSAIIYDPALSFTLHFIRLSLSLSLSLQATNTSTACTLELFCDIHHHKSRKCTESMTQRTPTMSWSLSERDYVVQFTLSNYIRYHILCKYAPTTVDAKHIQVASIIII